MKTPIIVAHRGLHDVHPENSFAAFRAAWDAGLAWAECDVHVTREGQVYVLHDATLERTTTGQGPIATKSYQELDNLRLRNADGQPTDERIPTLYAISSYMPPDRALLVELKTTFRADCDTQVFSPMRHKRWMFQSFDLAEVERIAAQERFGKEFRVPCALLLEEEAVEATSKIAGNLKCQAVHCDYRALNVDVVSRFRHTGKSVGAWTVNEEADIRRILSLGVDMIISDHPLRVRDICGKIG
jgi:glycerophosphoryl diester phosphodiesterase